MNDVARLAEIWRQIREDQQVRIGWDLPSGSCARLPTQFLPGMRLLTRTLARLSLTFGVENSNGYQRSMSASLTPPDFQHLQDINFIRLTEAAIAG